MRKHINYEYMFITSPINLNLTKRVPGERKLPAIGDLVSISQNEAMPGMTSSWLFGFKIQKSDRRQPQLQTN